MCGFRGLRIRTGQLAGGIIATASSLGSVPHAPNASNSFPGFSQVKACCCNESACMQSVRCCLLRHCISKIVNVMHDHSCGKTFQTPPTEDTIELLHETELD